MRRLIVIAPVAAALVLAACGSSTPSSSSAPASGGLSYGGAKQPTPSKPAGEQVKLSADGGGALAFQQKSLTAKTGSVTLVMSNPSGSGLPHGIGIMVNGADKNGPTVSPGSTSTVTVTLEPGTYTYYCPVPAHKAAGMTGTLTIS